ncbi:MAG: phosphatidylserine decarboxylase, partial [Acidobacteria bacterium]|nr:phosphatidylserine decarboxylase [Acidobacteriota bacterium]
HVTITIAGKQKLTFSLIAGLVARRIKVWSKEGAHVHKGDKIGLIRFGSRVDVVLPPECEVVVRRGDRVYGGSSIIAYWKKSS